MAARSLSSTVRSLVSDSLSGSIVFRRTYVAKSENVTAAGFSKGGYTRVMVGKIEHREDQETETAWAPDPVTGYYRPSNHAGQIDPAELRKMLLKNKAKSF